MRFRPVNAASQVMQSSVPTDFENLTPSRFNSTRNKSILNKSPNRSRFQAIQKEERTIYAVQSTSTDLFSESVVPEGVQDNKEANGESNETRSPSEKPALKKHKLEWELKYPDTVNVPSKSLIRALYEVSSSQEGSHQDQLDQNGTGLLSFEDVILPAVAREETNALKKLQAKAQRDAPNEAIDEVKGYRRAICEAIESAIVAARTARLTRENTERQRLERLEHERAEARAQRRLERQKRKEAQRLHRAQARKEARAQKQLEMKKQLPKNMEMWREVAFLMTEQANINREHRMWIKADAELDDRAEEFAKKQAARQNEEDDVTEKSSLSIDNDFKERVESAVEDITLSCLRIQRAIQLVSHSIGDANTVRSQLFKGYTKDHQFYGYAGVKDPKSLIRILSQE